MTGRVLGGLLSLLAAAWACASPAPDPERYRLTGSGTHWDVAGEDHVFEDLEPRYPEFFAVILDPSLHHEADLRPLRADIEHVPVDRRNFDALNAVAIAYFELNYRAEATRGRGLDYLGHSFRSAHLLAVPWKAYGLIADPRLRDAILDFFDDAARGGKLASERTAPRLAAIVASLEGKESDPARRERIRALVDAIEAASFPPP